MLICLFVPTNSRLLSYATCLAYERHEYRLTCTTGMTDTSRGGARGTGGSSAPAEELQPVARATRGSSNAPGALQWGIKNIYSYICKVGCVDCWGITFIMRN